MKQIVSRTLPYARGRVFAVFCGAVSRRVRFLVTIAVFMLAMAGCSRNRSNRVYIVAIDRSGSMDATRLEQLHDITQIRRAAMAQNADMEIWYYDKQALRIYGPNIPTDAAAIRLAKENYLAPDDQHVRNGTRPDALFDALNTEAQALKEHDLRLLVFTDGDNDFPADAPKIKDHIAKLSARPNITMGVFGMHPENDGWWTALVGTQMQGRFKISHQSDHDEIISEMVATQPQQTEKR